MTISTPPLPNLEKGTDKESYITFLGTGTSTGVPMLRCTCSTCTSTDPRDRRRRTSALVHIDGMNILIDCGPDLWVQLLDAGSPTIDAMLITHSHYDHVGGIDDLRPYCRKSAASDYDAAIMSDGPRAMPTYCRHDVLKDLKMRMPYCFGMTSYKGAPTFDIHVVSEGVPFVVGKSSVEITPLAVEHTETYHILGYKFGDKLVYITDCKRLPQTTLEMIKGVDTLVINALRQEPHPSHHTLAEALEIAAKTGARQTFLTHMCHDIGRHAHIQSMLPQGVTLAYDGLVATLR